jgi:uncharacterized protein (DUF2235 family)
MAQQDPKSIVLFSDGTGNSSSKLFKTNVWRMYEAVDLGPGPPDRRPQVSYYDDGVGTSGFKPLAALGGAFGWGLKRNVLELYRYACRNYRDGDHIYGFGFSRGAFTMRIVIAIIASQGLVVSSDDAELERRSRCAYRAFRTSMLPRKLKWPTRLVRHLRDRLGARRDRRRGLTPYDPGDNLHPVLRFVGVWDTVAAYGGPIAEITRAIDNWIFPLSMPDYQLSYRVDCARHALALDDQRDAFLPLLWDEVAEGARETAAEQTRKAAWAKVLETLGPDKREERRKHVRAAWLSRSERRRWRDRLRQVWFTGMHADVGGGYPDESLSYVSLLWMMEEAEKAGLRTLDVIKERFIALANSFGPLHDSRSGLGAYYRYQPRKIAAWIDPPDKASLMLRDPDVGPKGKDQGLLRTVRIHESVIARIADGTDRYAPISLPMRFEIVPPQREGETSNQADSETDGSPRTPPPPPSLVSRELRERLRCRARRRFAFQENDWDLVLRRRIVYFLTVIATLMLALMPWTVGFTQLESLCGDDRCVLPSMIDAMKVFVPGFAERWIDSFASHPVPFFVLVFAIAILLGTGSAIERRMHDRAYRNWMAAVGETPWRRRWHPTRLRRLRESSGYQRAVRVAKWFVLPGFFGLLMVAAILYLLLIGATQAWLAYNEPRDVHFCRSQRVPPPRIKAPVQFDLDISNPCVPAPGSVARGTSYDIVLQLPLDDKGEILWRDGNTTEGSPIGIEAGRLPHGAGYFGAPLRRLIGHDYLQPAIAIRRGGIGGFHRTHIRALELVPDKIEPGRYVGRFTAELGGSLHMFVNDSALPFGLGRFMYDNNCGVAQVTITPVQPLRRESTATKEKQAVTIEPTPPPAPACWKGRKPSGPGG